MATVESTTSYPAPGEPDSPFPLQDRYENVIGGEWTAPITGEHQTKCLLVSYDPNPLGFF